MSPSYIHIQHCPPSLLSSINTNTLSLFYPHNELRIRLELLESSSHFLLQGNSSQISTLCNCFAASHRTNHLISSLYPYPQPPTNCSRLSQSLPLSLELYFFAYPPLLLMCVEWAINMQGEEVSLVRCTSVCCLQGDSVSLALIYSSLDDVKSRPDTSDIRYPVWFDTPRTPDVPKVLNVRLRQMH